MEDKTYIVRISSQFNTESDWIAIDPVLLEGEIAIVTCKSDIPNTLPEVRIKSGDGIHKYSELPFISANSLDVYNWAKQKNKPSYYADEIRDLDKFISDHLGDHIHDIDDVNNLENFINDQINNHNHDVEDIIGLDLYDKEHTHSIDDIIGLRDELNKKADVGANGPSFDNNGDSSNGDNETDDDSSNDNIIIQQCKIIAHPNGGLFATQEENDFIIGINDEITFTLDGGDSSQFQS